jgi:uncharacterized membrane protein YccC
LRKPAIFRLKIEGGISLLSRFFTLFGPRILKTGLAVTVTILICQLFNIQPQIFAAITAVVNMQPSVTKALMNAWDQIRIHILGVVLATLLGVFVGNNAFVMGLCVILLLALVNRLKWEGVSLGVVSILFILDAPPEEFIMHAVTRSSAIFIGLAVALSINRLLAPPRYKTLLQQNLTSLFRDASVFFLASIEHFVHSTPLSEYKKAEPADLETRLDNVMELYEHAREEFASGDNALVIERLIELTRGFIERGENIEEMTHQRVTRRQAADSPLLSGDEISREFQAVLELLLEGKTRLETLREALQQTLANHSAELTTALDSAYWTKFDHAMEEWQSTVSGVFYLRAMMEVAVVATEMRWASKRQKSIYNLKNTKASTAIFTTKSAGMP